MSINREECLTLEINITLSKRELDVMKIFWQSGKPLTASEIVNISNISISTVHTVLNKLQSKNAIEVDEIIFSGKVLCRSYRPTISAKNYDMRKIVASFKSIIHTDISTSHFVSALLGQEKDTQKVLNELDDLEQMIKEKKKELAADKCDNTTI